jgi:tetrachlorobenzoquinone reductase
MSSMNDFIDVQIHSIAIAATDALIFELRDPGGALLPEFSAGAHVGVRLPGNIARHYSLVNSPGSKHVYQIAVRKQETGRGGSRFMHEILRVGDRLSISTPRNHFPLDEGRHRSVLVAGGIGITPLLSMIARLEELGREWELHYAARSRVHAPFLDALDTLETAHPGRVNLYFNSQAGQPALDIVSLVANRRDTDHFYCCGPQPMLAAFELACAALPSQQVHVEYFGPKEIAPDASSVTPADTQSFELVLHKSGITLNVPPEKSILDVALEAGVDAPFSCGEGFCGSCRTTVIEGIPEHLDSVLDDAQKASGNVMMICCSRSLSSRLVLDL